jgi:hypothetical protein
MVGPLSDGSASPFGPEVRLADGRVEVRRGPGDRLALLGLTFVIMVLGAASIAEINPPVGIAVMGAGLLPLIRLSRAATWHPVADATGWRAGEAVLPWDVVDAAVLFRSTADPLVLSTGAGSLHPLVLQVPARGAVRERRIAEDAVVRHAHQLAHQVGRTPTTAWVDLGGEVDKVPFDARCRRCAAPAPAAD